MRRKDREITDKSKIIDTIERCSCLRIGFYDNGEVYIVPLNFGFELENDTYTFYFHGAKEGRKAELIKEDPKVGFEMDTDEMVYFINSADIACNYTTRFISIVGNGDITTVEDLETKKKALSLIMKHNTGKSEWNFDENMLKAVLVFKLTATSLSCKEHK